MNYNKKGGFVLAYNNKQEMNQISEGLADLTRYAKNAVIGSLPEKFQKEYRNRNWDKNNFSVDTQNMTHTSQLLEGAVGSLLGLGGIYYGSMPASIWSAGLCLDTVLRKEDVDFPNGIGSGLLHILKDIEKDVVGASKEFAYRMKNRILTEPPEIKNIMEFYNP